MYPKIQFKHKKANTKLAKYYLYFHIYQYISKYNGLFGNPTELSLPRYPKSR